MKIIKKIAAIMLSVMMVLGMCSVVGAEGNADSGKYEDNTGMITITGAKKDQRYTIYRILKLESFSRDDADRNKGNYAYTVETGWESFVNDATTGGAYLTKDSTSGYVTWNASKTSDNDKAEFAKLALKYAIENSKSVTSTKREKTADTTSVTFTGLPLGYYLVDSSVGALCSLDTTAKEVNIEEKNGVPSVEKKVQEDSKVSKADEYGDSNTADIGQTVNFQTTITAQAGAQNYVLHDKMEKGLTFNNDINVKKDGTDVDPSNYTLNTNTTDGCTFEIVFTQEFCDALNADNTIIVTYSATLNENAVIGEKGNTNEAKLEYGDKKTISSKTITKTYQIPVFKYTKKNDGTNKGLSGAIFTLSKDPKGDNPIELVKITEPANTYRVAKKREAEGITKITKVTTPENGSFTIIGLDADTYFLTEIQQQGEDCNMRKHISTIIAGIVFLTGLSLLLYPTISNFWNSKHQTQAVADYSKQIEKMDDQEKEQALAAAEEYNQTLITNGGRFTPTEEEDTLYDSLLDANGTGMMGYITIPEIRCKLPIYHGVEDSVLQVGIGHIEGSSLPVGGKGTHCVLSGHRGLPSAKLFTDLDKLEKGDIFLLHIYDKVLTYEIDQISIVEPEDYGLLEIEDGKDLCTLLTCTPYGINTQRLLVRGHRIENRSGDDSRVTSDAAEVSSLTVAVCVAIPLLVISFLVVDLSIRRSRKKQKK